MSISFVIATIIISIGALGFVQIYFWKLYLYGSIVLILSILSFLYSFRIIPVAHVGIITVLGKRTRGGKGEGLTFLIPGIYNAIHIDATKKNKDLSSISFRTPDLAELKIPISITWTPDKNNLYEYLNSGSDIGVWDILTNIVVERVRDWAMNAHEGPATFQQALSAREEAAEVIFKAIAGKEMENKDNVEDMIKKRKEQMRDFQSGSGAYIIKYLGIAINRINVGDITVTDVRE